MPSFCSCVSDQLESTEKNSQTYNLKTEKTCRQRLRNGR
jgi:hypothetical protein